jgi:hypothetical protein
MEKLVYLFEEFKEGGVPGFEVEYDIIRKTVDFYGSMKIRFVETLSDVRAYARYHFRKDSPSIIIFTKRPLSGTSPYLHGILRDGNPDFVKNYGAGTARDGSDLK